MVGNSNRGDGMGKSEKGGKIQIHTHEIHTYTQDSTTSSFPSIQT